MTHLHLDLVPIAPRQDTFALRYDTIAHRHFDIFPPMPYGMAKNVKVRGSPLIEPLYSQGAPSSGALPQHWGNGIFQSWGNSPELGQCTFFNSNFGMVKAVIMSHNWPALASPRKAFVCLSVCLSVCIRTAHLSKLGIGSIFGDHGWNSYQAGYFLAKNREG